MTTAHVVPAAEVDALSSALKWSCSAPGPRDLAAAVLLAMPVPVIMAFTTVIRLNFDYHDVFIPLDAAWRTLQGQWPHSDFYSPIGLAYFWLHGAAAYLFAMDGRVVIWANLLALPFVILPALMLAWRRLDALPAVALIVLLAVLVTAPTFIDGPAAVIVHLANYNRIGGALAALVCLWALGTPRGASRRRDAADALVMGGVLLILLYLKLTFFAFSVATTVVGCLAAKAFRRSAALAALPVVLGATLLEMMHPGLMAGYLHDIARAGAANGSLFRRFYVVRAVLANADLEFLIAGLAALTAWAASRQRRTIAGIVVAAGGCILVSTQNFGAFSPSLAVLVMALAHCISADAGIHSRSQSVKPALAAAGSLAVLVATLPFVVTQVAGTVGHVFLSRAEGVVADNGRTGPLHNVMWYRALFEPSYMPDEFTVDDALKWQHLLPPKTVSLILGDGFDLIRREGLSGKRIANVNFSNPFPVGLRAPSPRGVALWWDLDRTFAKGKVTAGMIVGDAEVVMVPKLWPYYFVVENLTDVTRDLLNRDFEPRESRFWTAWIKLHPDGSPGPSTIPRQ